MDAMPFTSAWMSLRWTVSPDEARRIADALHALMTEARGQHGYQGSSLSTELGKRATLHYREDWESEDDLRRQIRSSRFTHVAELIDRASETPQVEFHVPNAVRGLDYAMELRKRR